VQLLALKLGDAAAVTAWAPSPVPAVNENVQLDLAVLDVWRAAWAPDTSTHLVSLLVMTVSVNAPPLFAYSVPPTVAVPAPPVNDADDTDDANVGRAVAGSSS
jgi:hypothetical protein